MFWWKSKKKEPTLADARTFIALFEKDGELSLEVNVDNTTPLEFMKMLNAASSDIMIEAVCAKFESLGYKNPYAQMHTERMAQFRSMLEKANIERLRDEEAAAKQKEDEEDDQEIILPSVGTLPNE